MDVEKHLNLKYDNIFFTGHSDHTNCQHKFEISKNLFNKNISRRLTRLTNSTLTTGKVGDAVIYSDTHNVYLSTYDKALSLAVDNLEIDGSLICKDNLKVDGEIYTGEINLTNVVDSNINGYAFKVNATTNNTSTIYSINSTL